MSGSNFGLAPPVVVNPLAAQTTALDAATKVYGLREKQSDEAWGQALQAATDANGNVDLPKAQSLASQNPLARQGMLKALGQTSTLANEQQSRNIKTNDVLGNAVGATLQLGDDQLKQGVLNQVERLVAARVITREQANASLMHMSSNPTELRQQLETLRTGLMPSDQATTQIYGPRVTINQGGSVTGGTADPRTGALRPSGQAVPLGLTPEQEAELVDVPDNNKTLPDGSPNPNYGHTTKVTRGDLLRAAGVDPRNPGGTGRGQLGTGRPPPALLNPNNPVAPAAPATPVAPRPVVTTRSAADEELIKQAGPKFQADIDAGTAAQGRQAILGNMLNDTTQFTTGPLAGVVGKVRNFVGALGVPINTDAQSAKESFGKFAAGLANAQGAGSDARLNVNLAANPHEELSPAGVDLILRQLQGNEDYIQAKAKLAQEHPNRTDYGSFQAKAKDLDPRVFQLTRMTQPQRDTYWKGLDSEAQKQLGAAIKKAKELGVLGG